MIDPYTKFYPEETYLQIQNMRYVEGSDKSVISLCTVLEFSWPWKKRYISEDFHNQVKAELEAQHSRAAMSELHVKILKAAAKPLLAYVREHLINLEHDPDYFPTQLETNIQVLQKALGPDWEELINLKEILNGLFED